MTAVLPLVDTPPLPYLPRCQAANVEIQDLDVTSPDLEAEGNGVDAAESCNLLASRGTELVSSLQMAGNEQMNFMIASNYSAAKVNLDQFKPAVITN